MTKYEVYYGPDYTATLRPIPGTDTDKPAQKPPARPPRTIAQSLKILDPYKPSDDELKLVQWAKDNLEPVSAQEVHAVIYRSVAGFFIVSPKDELRVRAEATRLGVGLPGKK